MSLFLFYGINKLTYLFHILYARTGLEPAVDVYSCQLGMVVSYHTSGIIRAYAPTKKERNIARIRLQYRPIELLAATANLWSTGVEEEHVYTSLIVAASLHVIGTANADSLYNCLLYTSPSPRD